MYRRDLSSNYLNKDCSLPPYQSGWDKRCSHKGLIYIEYHSVCVCRRNWDSPTPSPASECAPSPRTKGWGHTRLRARGWGSSISDDWKKLSTLPTLWMLPSHWDRRASQTKPLLLLVATELTLDLSLYHSFLWTHLRDSLYNSRNERGRGGGGGRVLAVSPLCYNMLFEHRE